MTQMTPGYPGLERPPTRRPGALKAVGARLGRSSPALTMAVYSHVTPATGKDAADTFDPAMAVH